MTDFANPEEMIRTGVIMTGTRGETYALLNVVKAAGLKLCYVRCGPVAADFEIIQSVELQALHKEVSTLRRMGPNGIRRYNLALARSEINDPDEETGKEGTQ